MLVHYYHIYCDRPIWKDIVTEHLQALDRSGLFTVLDARRCGIVGNPHNRQLVKEFIEPFGFEVIAEDNRGWEQVTMNVIDRSGDDKILYAHTKGAANPSRINHRWRASMTVNVIDGWEKCVELLDTADAVGSYWLPDRPGHHPRHFSGTFWWANSNYLRKLPTPVSEQSRWEAEMWIGRSTEPARIYDLSVGVHPIYQPWEHPLNAGAPPEGYEKFMAHSNILTYKPGRVYIAPSTSLLRALLDEGVRLTRVSGAGYREFGGLHEIN